MATLDEVRAQANSALGAGDHTNALALALLMQRRFPRDYQVAQLLGKVYLGTHRLSEASEAFRKVLEVDPEDVVSWSAMAMIAEDEGDLDGALGYFERAFDIDPGNPEIASEIARLHSRLSHTKAQEPGSSMHSMARRFLIEGKYESAVPWLQEALRITPESAEVAVGLTRALWLSWRLQDAEEVARGVLDEHPNCLRALAVLAGADFSKGGAQTLALLDRTAVLNPGNAVARALFEEAGIVFPEHTQDLTIPDSEVQEALAAASAQDLASSESGASLAAKAEGPEAGAAQPIGESESPLEPEERRWPDDEFGGVVETSTEAAEPEPVEEVSNPLLKRLATALREAQPEGGSSQPLGAPAGQPGPDSMAGSSFQAQDESPAVTAGSEPTTSQDGTGNTDSELARSHLEAAANFADQGLLDLAIGEYREALTRDASVAPDVCEAVIALADANPGSIRARWLVGDALATDGKFRKAVEQYLQVLRREVAEPTPDPGAVNWQD